MKKTFLYIICVLFYILLCNCNTSTKQDHSPNQFILFEEEEEFKALFKDFAMEYFTAAQARETKPIISFGVFTDCDINGFIIQYNTQEGIEKDIQWTIEQQKKNPAMFKDAKLDGTPWSIPEWITSEKEAVMDTDSDPRIRTCFDIMQRLYTKNTGENFVAYKNKIFDVFCVALSELKADNFFKNVSDDFALVVQECDNGLYETREKSLSKILNPEQLKAYVDFCNDYYEFE